MKVGTGDQLDLRGRVPRASHRATVDLTVVDNLLLGLILGVGLS
jgi:hypothetical protein